MLLHLDFANNNILSCFFSFFIVTDEYFLLHTAIAIISNSIAELVILIEIPSKETKAEVETHPVIVKANIRKC